MMGEASLQVLQTGARKVTPRVRELELCDALILNIYLIYFVYNILVYQTILAKLIDHIENTKDFKMPMFHV